MAAGDWPPSPRASPAAKCRKPLAVGLAGAEHLVVARDQPHLDACRRFRARQRMNEDVDDLVAAIGGEA